jgi:hypothetical protein
MDTQTSRQPAETIRSFYPGLAALAIVCGVAQPLAAQHQIGADDIRMTEIGITGTPQESAGEPLLVWSPNDQLFLSVWIADDPMAGLGDGDMEVFAAMIDPLTLQPVSSVVQVSDVGIFGDAGRDARHPAVAHNPITNSFLVVWSADDANFGNANNEFDIFARAISLSGAGIWNLSAIQRLTDVNGVGGSGRSASNPAVAWGSTQQQWLVAWTADPADEGFPAGEQEVFAQRVAPPATPIDSAVRISTMGVDGDVNADAYAPAVAYHPPTNRFAIVWSGDDVGAGWINGHTEIFGRQVFAVTGDPVTTEIQLSFMGPTDTAPYLASRPQLVWNRRVDRFFVVWDGKADAPGLDPNEYEVWGREFGPAFDLLATGQIRISAVGVDGDALAAGVWATVAWEPSGDQYVVAWHGYPESLTPLADPTEGVASAPEGGPPIRDQEIWSRSLRVHTLDHELGPQQVISDMGAGAPVPADFDALEPAIALASDSRLVVVWQGDDNEDFMVDDEFEIFGQGVLGHWIFVDDFETGDSARWSAVTP